MKITESPAVQAAVTAKVKEGLRDQVKKACTKAMTGGNQTARIQGMQAIAEVAGAAPDFIYAKIQGTVFIFSLANKTESQWAADIAALRPPSNPRKVLVKMVEQRIRSVHKHRQERINSKTYGPNEDKLPDFVSREVIFGFEAPSAIRHEVAQLQLVITRNEIQDDVILEAWNLSVARHIMEC